MKKRILCFGDSNTFGSRPSGGRFDEHTRWPMRMQELLGDDYTVVEEGFGGRTTALGVRIEAYPTHIAGLPAAVNMGCHVTRHAYTCI